MKNKLLSTMHWTDRLAIAASDASAGRCHQLEKNERNHRKNPRLV